MRDTDIPQTVDLLRKARAFAPGNDNLVVMLAFALSRTPQPEEARSLASSVLMKSSLTPAMRKNAETVLASLNQRRFATGKVSGILTTIECSDGGAALLLNVDGRTERFHSRTPREIRFSAAATSTALTIQCGPLPGDGVPVVIHYRPEGSSGSMGEPLAVEVGGDK